MTFLSPVWLFALVPWAAFAAWLLVGRRRRQRVPFLPLWDAPEELRRPKKGFEPPPAGLLFALLALLMTVLSIAEPVARVGRARGKVNVVVDRGASMSALVDGRPRYAGLAGEVGRALLEDGASGPVELYDAVTGQAHSASRSDWSNAVADWKRTAIDTADELASILRSLVPRGEPTLLLSDRDLGISGERLVQIAPAADVVNAGIVAVAAREGQVMVTVRSTDLAARTLTVSTAGQTFRQPIASALVRNVFVDVPRLGDMVEVSLEPADAFEGDDRAYLVRSPSWPAVEARLSVSDELGRMLAVYRANRPEGETSMRVALARPGDLRGDEPGVLLPSVIGAARPLPEVVVQSHPVVVDVEWSAVPRDAAVAGRGPGEGWTVVARAGDQPLLAVRDGPARQAWVGFESRGFARTPSFVVLWSNLLDWVGGGGGGFTSTPIDQGFGAARRVAPDAPAGADPAYWPGVFEAPMSRRAGNAPPVTFSAGSGDWRVPLSRLAAGRGGSRSLGPWLALAALAALVAAAVTWERRRRLAPHGVPASRAPEAVPQGEPVVAADGRVHRRATQVPPR